VPLSRNLGTLISWNPLGRSRPVTGLLYLFIPPFPLRVRVACYRVKLYLILPYLMIAHRERANLIVCFVSNFKGNRCKTSLNAEEMLPGKENCEHSLAAFRGRHLLPAFLHYITSNFSCNFELTKTNIKSGGYFLIILVSVASSLLRCETTFLLR